MLVLTIPFPPSVNNLFRNIHGGRVPTERYKTWLAAAGWAVKTARPKPIQGDVEAAIIVGRPDRRKRDLDNLAKAPLDLLVRHGLIEDDSRVVDLRIRWGECDGCRVEVRAA